LRDIKEHSATLILNVIKRFDLHFHIPQAVSFLISGLKIIGHGNPDNNLESLCISSSSSFLLGLGPVVCLYQSSSDVDVQLSPSFRRSFWGLLVLGFWCSAQLVHLSCPILSTWSLQFRLRVLTHLAMSVTLHSAFMSSLLIRSLKVTPFIFLKTLVFFLVFYI
jgi:hypothetical protein